jgi:serine/threonine-protein kinase
MDLKLIGEQLNVNYLLEGSVRRSGNTLRITAKLINIADDGSQMFSEQFDRELEDVFDIQDEISANILESIKIKLLGENKEAVFNNYTDNVEAYQLYLQGRYHVNKFTPDGFLKAIEFYDQAIALDSSYAIAYAGKSFCLTNLWDFQWLANEALIPLAIKAAQKALQLDDKISESHLAVGRIQLHQEWNVRDAMVKYEKAIELNPNSSEAHVQLAMCLSLYGRCEEALEHAKIAESLDPLSILNIFYSTIPIWACQDYETVLTNGQKLIDLEPDFFSGHMWAGAGYLYLGKYDEAIMEYELSAQLNPGIYTLGNLGVAYGMNGDTLKAREVIERIKTEKDFERLGSQSLANVYLSIGELETAFYYLDRSLEYREARLLWIRYSVSFLSPEILQDPRFEDLYDRMGVIY